MTVLGRLLLAYLACHSTWGSASISNSPPTTAPPSDHTLAADPASVVAPPALAGSTKDATPILTPLPADDLSAMPRVPENANTPVAHVNPIVKPLTAAGRANGNGDTMVLVDKNSENKSASEEKTAPRMITPSMTFAIPTMRRWAKDRTPAPVQYLRDLVMGILADASTEELGKIRILLYNVDPEPDEHKDAYDLAAQYPGIVQVLKKNAHASPVNDEGRVTVQGGDGNYRDMSMQNYEWIKGETKDAANLLFEARKLAPYVVFLEDDVKPTSRVIHKITEYMHGMSQRGINSWFMVDLYTPNITWATGGRNPLYVKNYQKYDYECCTQAMLFRSDKLLELLVYETSHPDFPIDDNIRAYVREAGRTKGREVYAIMPNLFEHVGAYSSNPEKSSHEVEHVSLHWEP